MNIVVLCGGLSIERDVSLCTGSLAVQALVKKGHNAVMVDFISDYEIADDDFIGYIKTCREIETYVVPAQAPDVIALRKEIEEKGNGIFGKNVLNLCMASDIVFMALHGGEGEDGRIQAILDMYGVKYTGTGYLGSAIAMSKRFTKQVFQVHDILSPKYRVLIKDEYDKAIIDDIKTPCVVKLSEGGSSIGVYIIHDKENLTTAVDKAFTMDDTIIIEDYIKGIEYTCGVLGGRGLPIVEIVPKERFYDYENKYQFGATIETCPAPSLNDEQTKKMQEISVKAHDALGLGVYSRADFIVDEKGDMYCLELNTLPGMTPTSLLPQEALAAGIDYEELCNQIVLLSLQGYND